jgi:hypothetical protein
LNPTIAARPLCPLVLSLLTIQPRRAHEVAAAGPLYQITRRGRGELRLQRMVWASLLLAAEGGG